MSGGYEDDIDRGDEIIYTGAGGRDPTTGEQVEDQELVRGNRALAKSMVLGHPVRVIRGAALGSRFAPSSGYRYDGLYRIEDSWRDRGRSGKYVWRFRLVKVDVASVPERTEITVKEKPVEPPVVESTVTRTVRDTVGTEKVKQLHNYHCQICGVRLESPKGPYAEAAHIRPLGRPHYGPDSPNNILCLCPNHHVLFDLGAFTIEDDGTLVGLPGSLRTVAGHAPAEAHLAYRREHYGV